MDRQGSVATLRRAVAELARAHLPAEGRWCVALSGGADSLALTAVAAGLRPTTALIVDHGLQSGSADVAATAREHALRLGCVDAQVLCVDVGSEGGPESAARTARYAALGAARDGAPVLLAHTLDDQAETVLLGLGRGTRRGYGPFSASDAHSCTRHARSWASPRGRTPTTSTRGSPGYDYAPRCFRFLRTCWVAVWPRHWHAPPPRCATTTTPSTSRRGARRPG
jgi:hypothetical protein